jgi:GGDEF domain-containing protein/2'-5' RNA ligase
MDNELNIFLQSFKEVENLFRALPITDSQFQQLKDFLSSILKNSKDLILYDSITHALNARARRWLVPDEQIKGMAKIDIYDLRQANKVYGILVVDKELHKLAFQLMSIFTQDKGDYVQRSPGSDEFRILSTSKPPQIMKNLLLKLYNDQESTLLLPWDFGVGLTETEAENELQKQRKAYRPVVLRQTILESHSEIPRRIEEVNISQSWNEFNMPYEKLIDKICAIGLPTSLEQQAVEQIRVTEDIVENIATKDALTGCLNGLGEKWYLERTAIKSVALTDMLNMHEGNSRYGSAAIDQDLKRFSNVLFKYFPKHDGYLLFRSERAGDEFKITSTKDSLAELENRIRTVWQTDLHRGLLAWNYGVGRNGSEAHVDLYRNRVKETEIMEESMLTGTSTFIIVRPESEDYPALFDLSEEKARVVDGTPIFDLHLTVQAIRNVDDFAALRKRLEMYAATLHPFEIKAGNIARMNVNNQQGRLWLLAEKNTFLENMYNDLDQIASEMGYDSYPYKSENWLPHIKIVELPESTTTQIKDPTFGAGRDISFTVRQLEWTVQKGPESWEMLDQFPFSQDPSY